MPGERPEMKQLIDLTLHLHAETDRAILVSEEGDERDAVWLPLSQCEVEILKDGIVEVAMPEWLALDKGLI